MASFRLRNYVREYWQAFGLTLKQLAEYVGVSKNTISSIETGVFCPTAYLAYRLSFAFGCKFEELFYLEANEGV